MTTKEILMILANTLLIANTYLYVKILMMRVVVNATHKKIKRNYEIECNKPDSECKTRLDKAVREGNIKMREECGYPPKLDYRAEIEGGVLLILIIVLISCHTGIASALIDLILGFTCSVVRNRQMIDDYIRLFNK